MSLVLTSLMGSPSRSTAQVADTTPPTIVAVLSKAPNAHGWHRADVRVRFTCSDTGSRIAFCPSSVLVAAEGAGQVISGTARDRAGNTATASVTVNLDKTAPVVTAAASPAAPETGWYVGPVSVTFAATDSLSGIAPDTLTAPVTLSTDRTNGSATGRATDLAGNVGTVTMAGINIDQRAPRITVAFDPVITVGGYRSGTVTAKFTCTDARSGIQSCPTDQVLANDGRDQVVTGSTTDIAGHTATVTKTIHIDSTAPVITVTSPSSAVVEGETLTITGTVTDALSGVAKLEADGVLVRRRTNGAFTVGPMPLAEGAHTVTLKATDRAGNVADRTLSFNVPAPEPEPEPLVNLIQDPQFDLGVSGFAAQDASSTVARTTESPIDGQNSLRVGIVGYGNNVWWPYTFAGGKASQFVVGARVRSDLQSASTLQFCAMAYYADNTTALACTPVTASVGDKGTITTSLALDATKALTTVNIRMIQEGGSPITFTLDNATAYLTVVEPPPPSNPGDPGDPGDPGPGGPGNPGGGDTCAVSTSGRYPGYGYQLPSSRPFISLNAYTQAPSGSTAYQRFRSAADAAIAGQPPYGYSATHSAIAHALIGDEDYLTDAIARVEAFVAAAETVIAGGGRPAISGDSYLEVGWYLEQLALTYDRGYARLTPEQRQRWAAFAEQSLFNVWHPGQATWGGVSHPWSGWSICDPGNNYHFSFLRATMLWALASQNQEWFQFLQTRKFGPLVDYYAALIGGGTREGTGYGTALNNLFGNFIIWKDSTGEDLSALTPHTRETIDYWVHATVPTLDRFAPIGDLSRSSIPDLYDYHENLVHQAVVLSPGTPQARRGTWWLQQNSVNGVQHAFNLAGDLLPYPDQPVAPSALVYHSTGAGALFARTSWGRDATWMSVIAGKYDQSHAHQDQGSFTLFRDNWMAVTNNIWSYSGIHQGVEVHNTLRFQRSNGSVIPQNASSSVQSSMTSSTEGAITTIVADLVNAYSANRSSIQSWTRTLVLSPGLLRVTDACVVADGIQSIFQVQVPVLPVLEADGSIRAGGLHIVPMSPVTASIVPMPAALFQRGYRVDLTSTAGCGFDVELRAAAGSPAPTPNPAPNPNPTPNPSPTPTPAPNPTCEVCTNDPVEPVWSEVGGNATRIKSPAQHMRFTEGAPIRILADVRDGNAWACPPGHPPYVCPGTEVRFYVDGDLVGTAMPSPTDFNLWEVRLPSGLPVGSHVLTIVYVPYNPSTGGGGTPINGQAPVTIHVDPAPVKPHTISLAADMVLSGSTDLDWTDTRVVGNGYTVSTAPGYTGNVIIKNAHVSGLGSFTQAGLRATTTGAITVESSTFEATGGSQLTSLGTAPFVVTGNEWRANNLLTYVASNPDVPVVLQLTATNAAIKRVQGNRIGAGILRVQGNGWQIGGLDQGQGNVLIGPRVVLELVNASETVIQGNYMHHDYHGGFSQGFNLLARGTSANQLVEHNVIRGGSWPVQGIGGEFRYNLVVDSGHNFWRSVLAGTQIHHNLFVQANGPNTGYDGGIQIYNEQTGITVFNNTFDVGGAIGRFDGPAFNIGAGGQIDAIRNNLFTGFSAFSSFGGAFVSSADSTISAPRVLLADVNAWHNPLAPTVERYRAGLVGGTPGLSDVVGAPFLSGTAEMPYRVSESCVWRGNCTTGQVLAHYRAIYKPAAGSPLISPVIGAIGFDATHPLDNFGRIIR